MPELPEVQTTVDGLNAEVRGLKIVGVWTDYKSHFHRGKENIKNPKYFEIFKREVVGTTITGAERQGKNVLIHLSRPVAGKKSASGAKKTILVHMKMTGHFLFGEYFFDPKEKTWQPRQENGPLSDPRNKFVHLVFDLAAKNFAPKNRTSRKNKNATGRKQLAFSDMRKFGKIFLFDTENIGTIEDLMRLGPDPLSKECPWPVFKERLLLRPTGKIKPVLMDQQILSGIGNIYSDEMLWSAGIHPLSIVRAIPEEKLKKLFEEAKAVLKKGIDFGGDSDSDYRNIHGRPGKFQSKHNAYRRTGESCPRRDGGTIRRLVIAGRSAHFCDKHQKIYK